MIFSKLDKKALIIVIIVIIVILVGVFVFYRYVNSPALDVQNSIGGAQTEGNLSLGTTGDIPEVQMQANGTQTKPSEPSEEGVFSICLDKCGDDFCQQTDPDCGVVENRNCICQEDPQDCPQDCKY